MKQVVSRGIVLARTNFGEADRIVTMLSDDQGKLRLITKGARRAKSKLAGGIELFSVNHITFIQGRGEIGTLISSRIIRNYGNIVKDINRTMFGYEMLKRINRMTDEIVEPGHYELLDTGLRALNESNVPLEILEAWFGLQLLKDMGQQPNLQTDTAGAKLDSNQTYSFSVDDMTFAPAPQAGGPFDARFIKLLRLAYQVDDPGRLLKIKDLESVGGEVVKLVRLMTRQYLPTGVA